MSEAATKLPAIPAGGGKMIIHPPHPPKGSESSIQTLSPFKSKFADGFLHLTSPTALPEVTTPPKSTTKQNRFLTGSPSFRQSPSMMLLGTVDLTTEQGRKLVEKEREEALLDELEETWLLQNQRFTLRKAKIESLNRSTQDPVESGKRYNEWEIRQRLIEIETADAERRALEEEQERLKEEELKEIASIASKVRSQNDRLLLKVMEANESKRREKEMLELVEKKRLEQEAAAAEIKRKLDEQRKLWKPPEQPKPDYKALSELEEIKKLETKFSHQMQIIWSPHRTYELSQGLAVRRFPITISPAEIAKPFVKKHIDALFEAMKSTKVSICGWTGLAHLRAAYVVSKAKTIVSVTGPRDNDGTEVTVAGAQVSKAPMAAVDALFGPNVRSSLTKA